MNESTAWVTACIPTFRCTQYLREAVMSLLRQTYPFVRVIVINDGDPEAPWPALADVTDPRLLRFDLGENRGPYFALAIALEATQDPFFLVQDADDWSAPERVESLMSLLVRDRSAFACSTLAQFHRDAAGQIIVDKPLFWSRPATTPATELSFRIPHHGMFRAEVLRKLGGYFGGFPFGYDEFLTNLLTLTGSVSWTPDRLYWRRRRAASLTQSPDTGMESPMRQALRSEMRHIYRYAFQDYQGFLSRSISGDRLVDLIRWRVECRRGVQDSRRIREHASRLRSGMTLQSRGFAKAAHPSR